MRKSIVATGSGGSCAEIAAMPHAVSISVVTTPPASTPVSALPTSQSW